MLIFDCDSGVPYICIMDLGYTRVYTAVVVVVVFVDHRPYMTLITSSGYR